MSSRSKRPARYPKCALLPLMVAIGLMVSLRAAPDQLPAARVETAELPNAPGSEAVKVRCLTCHGADIIRGQRLSKAGWEREVEKMVGWGAQLGGTERGDIIEYLSAQFGVKAAAPAESEETAAATLLPRCLTCHDLRLIGQQRLTAAGWIREIDKMIGWGATLTESERNLLSEYLAKRFGPEK
jgi:mono/diheme cytochrome c family protein